MSVQIKPRILLTQTLPEVAQKRIESFDDIELIHWKDNVIPHSELLKLVKGVDGLICMITNKIDEEVIETAGDQLKVVSTMSVGYDHVSIPALKSRSIPLGYTPDVLTDAVADLAVLLVLTAARRLREGISAVYNGDWKVWCPTWLLGCQLTDKTIGIIGLGRIGLGTAKRLKPFLGSNGRIIYAGRTMKKEAEEVDAKKVEFDVLIKEADVVIISCSLTEETRGMFDYGVFKKMKNSVILVNIARGSVINQPDLVRALSENRLGAVALDVTTPEPLSPDDPLLKFKNVTVMPHLGSATVEARTAMANIAIDNLLAGIKGEKLPYRVELD
ncbi:1530_t:CDS:2 [Paraglomus occultum]|uniref:1530_t:CDS:1 n=1 Tax=Paraglomus occultum TaxID=144539 RepID=A0A9N8WQA3_9GLOM|nr:1530_t:CDS:2 [Paraglomus occultum]